MIRNFFHFYRVWRRHHNRWGALKCAWSLIWLHRRIDKDIKELGSAEYIRRLMKKSRQES